MRGPTGVLGGPGASGEYGVVAGRTQRTAPLPGLGLHRLDEGLDVVEVAQPVGGEGVRSWPNPTRVMVIRSDHPLVANSAATDANTAARSDSLPLSETMPGTDSRLSSRRESSMVPRLTRPG